MTCRTAKTLVLLGAAILLQAVLLTPSVAAEAQALNTVDKVDLERYAGRWHEVARIPNRFQKKCLRSTTADYSLRDDGRINVVNSCIKKDGKINEADGVARIVDKESNAKLQVSFVSVFGWYLFWGDYWIIGLDDDYQWVVVGHPERKFGWILSRTPTLSAAALDEAFAILARAGYSRADFEMSAP